MIDIVRQENGDLTTWSGGTTRGLFKYPVSGDFRSGHFKCRLSIATVDVEETVFTALPNVSRQLMVIAGALTLDHGDRLVDLKPYRSTWFDGGEYTASRGLSTNLNLMLANGATGRMIVNSYQAGDHEEVLVESDLLLVFLAQGEVQVNGERLAEWDVAVINRGEADRVEVRSFADTTVIYTIVNF